MIKLNNAIDKVIFNMTVRAMLDPNNKYFYIPKLTLEKVEVLCDNDDDKTEMFWLCYNYASNQYLLKQRIEELEELEEIGGLRNCEFEELFDKQDKLSILENVCPECYCQNYVQGCCCPNCGYND